MNHHYVWLPGFIFTSKTVPLASFPFSLCVEDDFSSHVTEHTRRLKACRVRSPVQETPGHPQMEGPHLEADRLVRTQAPLIITG